MPLEFYKIFHITSIAAVLIALGGASFSTFIAGAKPVKVKKFLGILHGIGILLILISGFGMLAKLQISGANLPSWALLKIIIWIILGGWMTIAYKISSNRLMISVLVPILLTAVAAYLGIVKI